MKHIKKKFLLEARTDAFDFTDPRIEQVKLKGNTLENVNEKEKIAFIQTDEGKVVGGFIHKINGKSLVFPVPDPTLIYFNTAYLNVRLIKNLKKKLLKKVSHEKQLNELALNEFYEYFGNTSTSVIFMFMAIESFLNQAIPTEFVYKSVSGKKTELYNKLQIQENIDFKTKITLVLKQISGKNFFEKSTPTNQYIWNLKEFRDDLVHTKQELDPLKYNQLMVTSLNFDYEKALNAVTKFMNFYKKEYIEECKCGRDF
ncbi:MAG: hypothetical protein HRT73_07860 [Flavobacteriales bacterium]|nr:hypothetical protein [Flavobacteriales bacterium]